MWWLTSQKNGASALGLQRALGLGSYKTAWTWLHKLRRAMVRPGRDRLSGRVEVDETYLGALEEGVRGRQTDAKALIAVAAEEDGAGIGRIRMRTIPNASGDSLMAFVGESVEPGSVVHTDGWLGYGPLESDGYRHEVSYLDGQPARASELLPRVHRVVSLLKRWILGTHQGAASPSATSISTPTSTNSPSASTAASPEVEASSSTAWCSRPSPSNRCPTSRWSEAPQHMLRTTTTCRGYFKIPESSEYPSHFVLGVNVEFFQRAYRPSGKKKISSTTTVTSLSNHLEPSGVSDAIASTSRENRAFQPYANPRV